jgi:hypothetical protein
MKFRLIILLLWIVISCSPSGDSSVREGSNRDKLPDNPIVLFNISDSLSREQIAVAITNFSKCNPSVIGVESIFYEPQSSIGDSLLATSISESGKVVLSADFDSKNKITSNDLFRNNIFGDGIIAFASSDGEIIDKFIAIYDSEGGSYISFPFILATIHDPNSTKIFDSSIWLNREYDIKFYLSQQEFSVYDYKDLNHLNCDDIGGKIVIMGYLGPSEFQKHKNPIRQG